MTAHVIDDVSDSFLVERERNFDREQRAALLDQARTADQGAAFVEQFGQQPQFVGAPLPGNRAEQGQSGILESANKGKGEAAPGAQEEGDGNGPDDLPPRDPEALAQTKADPETLTNISVAIEEFSARLPRNITVGAWDAANQTTRALLGPMADISDRFIADNFPALEEAAGQLRERLEDGAGTSDEIVQGMTQFFLPFAAYMKLLGATTSAGPVLRSFQADALASSTALDPHMERLSTFVTEMEGREPGFLSDFIAWMGDNNAERESELEGRMKNMLEGQALGAGFMGAFQMVRFVYNGGLRNVIGQVLGTGPVSGTKEAQLGMVRTFHDKGKK